MADEQAQEAERRRIYESLKRLKGMPEWKVYLAHIASVVTVHKEASVDFLAKDVVKDAQRQAWIVEGLLEAVGEPESIVSEYESAARTIKDALRGMVQKTKDFVTGK